MMATSPNHDPFIRRADNRAFLKAVLSKPGLGRVLPVEVDIANSLIVLRPAVLLPRIRRTMRVADEMRASTSSANLPPYAAAAANFI